MLISAWPRRGEKSVTNKTDHSTQSIHEMLIKGRKFGCTTYSYSARKVGLVGQENPKVIITARNDVTGELIMNESTDINSVRNNGLPLPGLSDIIKPIED